MLGVYTAFMVISSSLSVKDSHSALYRSFAGITGEVIELVNSSNSTSPTVTPSATNVAVCKVSVQSAETVILPDVCSA